MLLSRPTLPPMRNEVVGLSAWCDFVPEEESLASPGSVSFAVHEFAVLDDGRRITLQTDRGFSVWGPQRPANANPLTDMTAETIERDVRTTVLPDEEDSKDEHPYEEFREVLRLQGVFTTPEVLRSVPYGVEFSERLRRLLT